MTVLRHALCGDDFDQTPVSIVFREICSHKLFFSGFVGDATQVSQIITLSLLQKISRLLSSNFPKKIVCGAQRVTLIHC